MRLHLCSMAVWLGVSAGIILVGNPCPGQTPLRAKAAPSIESTQWFPDSLSVVYTNRAWFMVPDPLAFKNKSSLKGCQKVIRGGMLKVKKGDGSSDERTFIVGAISSNAVMLSVRGTLQQMTVPFVMIDR